MLAAEGGGPEVNKIEQVSIDDHQISLARGSLGVPDVPCWGGGGACTVSSNASWIMITCGTPPTE